MNKSKSKQFVYILVLCFVMCCFLPVEESNAQDSSSPKVEMADKMRSEGKIYVVVLVVAIVFTGLTIFAINTDRKLTRLEKDVKNLKSGDQS